MVKDKIAPMNKLYAKNSGESHHVSQVLAETCSNFYSTNN